jgi:hypothetical protein
MLLLAGGCLGANPDWDEDAAQDSSSGDASTAATTGTTTGDPATTTPGTSTTSPTTNGSTSTTSGGSTGGDTNAGSTGELPEGRILEGIATHYNFVGGNGGTIVDESGLQPAMDMQITGEAAWSAQGLTITGDAILTTVAVPSMRIAADEFTVELWVDSQSGAPGLSDGPRIVAFEEHSQGLTNFFVSGGDGLIGLTVPADGTGATDDFVMNVEPGMRHVVFTVSPLGQVAGYENGMQELFGSTASLNPSLWMDNLPFVMANASDSGHPWQGEIALIAVYGRALTPAEVLHNFEEGY